MNHLASFLGLDFTRTVTPSELQSEASPIVRAVFETGQMFLSEYEDDVVALHCTADDVWVIEGDARAVIFENGSVTTRELPETDSVSPPAKLDEDTGDVPLHLNAYDVIKRKKGSKKFAGIQTSRELESLASEVVDDMYRGVAMSFKKEMVKRIKKNKKLLALIAADDFDLNESTTESTTPDNSQETEDMTITKTTSAALKISENKIELIPASGEGDALIECELTDDSHSHLRAVTAQIEEQAAEMGFDLTIEFDEDLDEDSDEYADALAEATHEILEGISALLGDNLGSATMTVLRDVRAFDEALAEGDFDSAFMRAEIIAATIDEDLLEAVKRMSRGAIAKRMRSAKTQTPAEKMRNRKAAKKRKTGSFKAKAKKYRKRYKARPGSKRESTDDGEGKQLTLDEMYSDETYKASYKGKAGADDSLRKAAMGHFKGTAGKSALFGTLKAQGSQYVGGKLKESSDSDLLKVLSALVHEGFLAYEAGEGYSATAKLIEFTLED